MTPYRVQVRALKDALSSLHEKTGSADCPFEVNTADQYQGRDKAIIIVSFVSCLTAPNTAVSSPLYIFAN